MKHLHFSGPAVVFAVILVLVDYAHTIADSGLSFKSDKIQGPLDYVLSVKTSDRNRDILFEVVGDPFQMRTIINSGSLLEGNTETSVQLAASILSASDAIARGESPLLSTDSALANNFGFSDSEGKNTNGTYRGH